LINQFPNSNYLSDALSSLGHSLFHLNKYLESIKYFQRLSREYPQSNLLPDTLMSIGDCYAKLGRPSKALSSYQDLINRFPDSDLIYKALNEKGKIYLKQHEYARARNVLTQVIDSQKEELAVSAQYLIGITYEEEKNYQQAIVSLMKTAYLYPEKTTYSDLSLSRVSDIYKHLNKYAEAIKVYEKLLKTTKDETIRKKTRHELEVLKQKVLKTSGKSETKLSDK
ncbi:MAG: tetratricopeptide repeat protein, partial [bacterium]